MAIADEMEDPVEETTDAAPAEEPVAEEPVEAQAEEPWTRAMALDERRKRQELEDKNREMAERLARLEGRIEATAGRKATVVEDPEPELDYGDLEGSIPRIVEHRMGKQVKAMESKLAQEEKALWQAKCEIYGAQAQAAHEDYSQVEKQFVEMANSNPVLWRKVKAAHDPAEWAYQYVKNHAPAGDKVSALEKELAELKAQLKGGAPPPTKKTNLAGVRGSGVKPASAILSPETALDEAFEGR